MQMTYDTDYEPHNQTPRTKIARAIRYLLAPIIGCVVLAAFVLVLVGDCLFDVVGWLDRKLP